MARQALARQAQQSLLAVCVATLALLALAPLTALVRGAVALGGQHRVPFDEVSALMALLLLSMAVEEELVGQMMHRTLRLGLLAGAMAIQVALWALAVAVAQQHGVTQGSAAGVPIGMAIFLLGKPLANLLRPRQSCAQRLRRASRELKMGLIRVGSIGTGLLVVLYVYLTVFTQLEAILEVMVMGVAMPLLQAILMTSMAWMMERHGRKLSTANKVNAAGGGAERRGDGRPPAELETRRTVLDGKNAAPRRSRSRDAGARVSLNSVLVNEVCFSTGAFATLALAERDQTFIFSLVSMTAIEIAQVALHVKARSVVSRVAAEGTADTLLGDDLCIREWLLHQELGEKIGVLMALGLLAIDKTLGRDVAAEYALTGSQLAQRGLCMVLFELVGDLGKDVVSQALGVIPRGAKAGRVKLLPLCVSVSVIMSVNASFLVQTGLAIGAIAAGAAHPGRGD